MYVHLRAGFVVRNVIEHAVETQRGAVGDGETQTGETTYAEIISVAVIPRTGPALELVAGASATGTDDELALPAAEKTEREVVVQAGSERVRVDIGWTDAAGEFVVLRRVIAVTLDLPTGIREEDSQPAAVSQSILWIRNAFNTGVLVEPRPLGEATELHGSRKWGRHLVPPHVRSISHRIRSGTTAEKIAEVGRELETGLRAEIELPAVRGQVVYESVDTQRDAAEAQVES